MKAIPIIKIILNYLIFNKTITRIICVFIPVKSLRQRIRTKAIKATSLNKFIKTQYHYKIILKKIHNKSINEKVKILFLATRNQVWGVQSVYNSLKCHNRIETTVISLPTVRENGIIIENYTENINFFNNKDINFINGYDCKNKSYLPLKEIGADIVFLDTPYEHTLPKEYRIDEISKFALTCYVPYGFMIPDTPQINFNNDFHNMCWRIFCETKVHKRLYQKHGSVGGINAIPLGFPKLDDYKLLKTENAKYWKINKNKYPKTKRIIWAPHHSFTNGSMLFSTFDKNYQFFFDLAKKYKT